VRPDVGGDRRAVPTFAKKKNDQRLSAQTWDEMVKAMTRHVLEKHPDTAKAMERMHNEDPAKWGRETKPKWDAKPES